MHHAIRVTFSETRCKITAGGGQEGDTGRIEAFSDAVFAIAITLLIIEIGVPHVGEEGTLFESLVHLWPSYLGYATSFLVIGTVWANHHNRFRLIPRSDHILLFLNILFLMCVAFIPFPTALLAEYIREEAPEYHRRRLQWHAGPDGRVLHPALALLCEGLPPDRPEPRPFAAKRHDAPLRARHAPLPCRLRARLRKPCGEPGSNHRPTRAGWLREHAPRPPALR